MRHKGVPKNDERGWALVSVLCTIAVLTLLLGAAQSLSYQGALREHRALTQATDDAALGAAILRAVLYNTKTQKKQHNKKTNNPKTQNTHKKQTTNNTTNTHNE